ncbi:MAG: GAF domain-containing protein [Phycisphaerales bacterium]|nr:GAF domain-containing protein [Phycisphaerales bacterium]
MSDHTPTARPVDRERALERLLEISKRLGESSELGQVLGVIIDALRDLLDADRATVFTFDASSGELIIHVAHGVESGPATEIRIAATAGIAGASATGRIIVNVPNAYADPRFNRDVDRQTGYRTKTILAIPLIDHDGELVGVAQVLNKRDGAFTRDDEVIAAGVAAHAAIALRRAQLIKDHLQKVALERELGVAREIQESSFPKSIPSHPAFDIVGHTTPASECGGDAYDLFGLRGGTIAAEGETADAVALLIADATGHGVGPAISSMQTRGMLRICMRTGQPLRTIVRELSLQLADDLPASRFVTVWIGVLDFETGVVECFSAGQGPVFVYRRASDAFEEIDSDAPPFGIRIPGFFDEPTRTLALEPGDILMLLTDGYFEAMDPSHRPWGAEPIQAIVRQLRDEPVASIREALDREVLVFAQGPNTDDDRTVILVKRLRA